MACTLDTHPTDEFDTWTEKFKCACGQVRLTVEEVREQLRQLGTPPEPRILEGMGL